jgi:hypothetical protein
MACHPEQPFTAAQEKRIREIAHEANEAAMPYFIRSVSANAAVTVSSSGGIAVSVAGPAFIRIRQADGRITGFALGPEFPARRTRREPGSDQFREGVRP